MEAVLKYPAVFLTGALLAALLTRFWLPLAPRWGFMDVPGGRKIHRRSVPVAGGLAVFLAFHGACALIFLYPWKPFSGQIGMDWWFRFLPLSCAVLALGLVDDRIAIRPWTKLAGQLVVASGAYALDIRVQNVLGATLPGYVDFIATVFWFLLLMNAFNLIDGVDGLAAGIALIAAIGISVSLVFRSAPADVLLFLGFAGACAGFLRYNFFPARIFLGDTGSLFLGFTLAALAISTNSKGPATAAIGMPLLAAGVPLFDTLLAVWRRTVRRLFLGKAGSPGVLLGVDRADDEHLHHRLLKTGRGHHQVAWMLYAASAGLALVGILVSFFHDRAIGIMALAFLLGAYTILRHLAWIELRDSGEAVLRGLARPVRRNRAMMAYVMADLLILVVTLWWVDRTWGQQMFSGALYARRNWIQHAPYDIGLPILFLLLFRSYSRVWYLARVSEYVGAGIAVAMGYWVAMGLRLLRPETAGMEGDWIYRSMALTGTAAPLMVGIRALRRVVQDLMNWFAPRLRGVPRAGMRALVCGTSRQTALFLRNQAFRNPECVPLEVVGLVDDDAAVRGHFVHGIRVLGNWDDLPRLITRHRIEAVYVVDDPGIAREEELRAAVRGTGVRLFQWALSEREWMLESAASGCSGMAAPGADSRQAQKGPQPPVQKAEGTP